MALQSKHWMSDGKKLKYLTFRQVEQVDGIWIARHITVNVVRADAIESSTVLHHDQVALGREDVSEEDFTEQRLQRGAAPNYMFLS